MNSNEKKENKQHWDSYENIVIYFYRLFPNSSACITTQVTSSERALKICKYLNEIGSKLPEGESIIPTVNFAARIVSLQDKLNEYSDPDKFQKNSIEYKIAVMLAAKAGKAIEYMYEGKWVSVTTIGWNWIDFTYRVKPEEKIIFIDGKKFRLEEVKE